MTRAGKLSRSTTPLSSKVSIARDRAMAMPSVVPAAIASVKATATRASVAPRSWSSSPCSASSTRVASTVPTPGNSLLCAIRAVASQATSRTSNDAARSASAAGNRAITLPVSVPRPVQKGARCQIGARSDECRAAEFCEQPKEMSGCVTLGSAPVTWDPIAIGVAQPDQLGRVGRTRQRSDSFPLRIGSGKNFVGCLARPDKPVESRLVLHRPTRRHDITGHRQVSRKLERGKSVADREKTPHAGCLELGGERPIGQHGIEPSGHELLAQQWRCAEALLDLGVEIEAELGARVKPQHQPALVDGTASDSQPLPG